MLARNIYLIFYFIFSFFASFACVLWQWWCFCCCCTTKLLFVLIRFLVGVVLVNANSQAKKLFEGMRKTQERERDIDGLSNST